MVNLLPVGLYVLVWFTFKRIESISNHVLDSQHCWLVSRYGDSDLASTLAVCRRSDFLLTTTMMV
jgi:hypothetical protein